MPRFFTIGLSIPADKRDLFTSKFESALLRYNVQAYFGPINSKKFCSVKLNHLSLKKTGPQSTVWDLKMAKKLLREGIEADCRFMHTDENKFNSHEVITLYDDGTPQKSLRKIVVPRRTAVTEPEIIALDEISPVQHVVDLSEQSDASVVNLIDDSFLSLSLGKNNDSDIQILNEKINSPVKRKAERDIVVLSSNVRHVDKNRKIYGNEEVQSESLILCDHQSSILSVSSTSVDSPVKRKDERDIVVLSSNVRHVDKKRKIYGNEEVQSESLILCDHQSSIFSVSSTSVDSPVKRKDERDIVVLSSNVRHVAKKRKIYGNEVQSETLKRRDQSNISPVSRTPDEYFSGTSINKQELCTGSKSARKWRKRKRRHVSENSSNLKITASPRNTSRKLETKGMSQNSSNLIITACHENSSTVQIVENSSQNSETVRTVQATPKAELKDVGGATKVKTRGKRARHNVQAARLANTLRDVVRGKKGKCKNRGGRSREHTTVTPKPSNYYESVSKAVNKLRRSPRLLKRFLPQTPPKRERDPARPLACGGDRHAMAFRTQLAAAYGGRKLGRFNDENIFNPNPVVLDLEGLRPIVIDGCNTAYEHGRGAFSAEGVKICVDYFHRRGHTQIKAFFPQHFESMIDKGLKSDLDVKCNIVFTPSRKVNGVRKTPYDDRFIVQYAAEVGGVIVSRDMYRDLMLENPRWKNVIDQRLLMPTFADNLLIFPMDPLGRSGPSLDQFLRF